MGARVSTMSRTSRVFVRHHGRDRDVNYGLLRLLYRYITSFLYISEVGSSAVENFCEVGSRAVAQYSSRNSTAYDLQYGWQNDTANSQNVKLAVEQ